MNVLEYLLVNSLPAQVASGARLELDDDLGQFHVSLLLQLGQDTGPEKHLGVTDAVGRWVQV